MAAGIVPKPILKMIMQRMTDTGGPMNVSLTPARERPAGARQMRAARLIGPGRIEIVSLPLPEPSQGEVRIAIEACGVCASNLGPWAGPEWMSYPTEAGGMGHEGWGTVEALGAGVTGLAEGQRVAFLGQRSYASHEIVPAAHVVPLPEGIAFPAEPVACALNIFRRSGIGRGDKVAIIGVGFLGALLTRLAADAGAEVIAISRRDESLAMARRMGAARTIAMLDHQEIIDEVRDLTNGYFCDVVIEAVGKQWPLDLAGELVAEGGRLVIAGYHQDGPRQVNMQQWNWRGIDVVNAHERRPETYLRGMREAVEAVQKGRLDLAGLLTHSFPLDRLDAALDATRDKPEGFVKAVVTCS
ncbi:threonine dehydrogenase-like Zn-dependent dehydrogenase [Cereibacter azotoformans]|uniref:Threonine dehydrogenase-like Zn-dependent dehydrogenase n=2 Tax=Cereibacter azotoformans TaxID=43057 RepID=A0A2T5K7W8_9RHOB|nr:threonine dehydrogenase-like Zn-dependent dehydrogenase [Cereibacter azotoformans]